MPSIETSPVHIGRGGVAAAQPPMTGGMDWYADYAARTAADGAEGWLVSAYTFTESWTSWEMHPAGEEVVICTAGRMTLHQEFADGTRATVALDAGDYAINPRGTWHTADVDSAASAIFMTCGAGTEHRER